MLSTVGSSVSHSSPGVSAPRSKDSIVLFSRSVVPLPFGLYGVVHACLIPFRFNKRVIELFLNSRPLSDTMITGDPNSDH